MVVEDVWLDAFGIEATEAESPGDQTVTETTEYALGFSAGSAACMYIFRQVLAMVKENRRDKDYNGNGHGETSRRPMSFWVGKFDALDVHAQRQTEILEKQTELLQEHGKALVELVTIAKMQAKL